MPHNRNRHVLNAFQLVAKHSPLVGLFGHRQVGKSTFLEKISKEYVTLDDENMNTLANFQPKEFLKQLKLCETAIDECQMAPPLFPALKLHVQRSKKPGQIYLSGSVRFSSRKAIRESLTGRLGIVELLPMSIAETKSLELSNFYVRAINAKTFSGFEVQQENKLSLTDLERYMQLGGLPGICFARSQKARERMIRDILSTMLDRDLKLVLETPLTLNDLFKFCRAIASQPFEPLQYTHIAKESRIHRKTVASLLGAFQSIFLLREIPMTGGHSTGSLYWFEDQFEQLWLSNGKQERDAQVYGAIYRNARTQFEYSAGTTPEWESFMTRAGTRVPLVIRNNEGKLGILYRAHMDKLDRMTRAAVDSFFRHYPNGKILILTEGNKIIRVDDRTMILPIMATM